MCPVPPTENGGPGRGLVMPHIQMGRAAGDDCSSSGPLRTVRDSFPSHHAPAWPAPRAAQANIFSLPNVPLTGAGMAFGPTGSYARCSR